MTTTIAAVNITSATNFSAQHLQALSQTKTGYGTITTSDNGRQYHVIWNKSGTVTVQRDTSNVDVFTRLMEFFKRGISTPTFAVQLTGRLNELSTQMKNKKIIEGRLVHIEKQKNELKKISEECSDPCPSVKEQYQKTTSAKKNAIIREFDKIKDRLIALKESNDPSLNFDQKMGEMNKITKALALQIVYLYKNNGEAEQAIEVMEIKNNNIAQNYGNKIVFSTEPSYHPNIPDCRSIDPWHSGLPDVQVV